MSKLVLTEFLEFRTDSDLLTEAEKKAIKEGEEIYLAGVMQRAGATNGNGRIYPKQILEREVENYQKLVREGTSPFRGWDREGLPTGQALIAKESQGRS